MNSNVIFLVILISSCSAVVYKKLYLDHTSWSFQHPTSTWTNARFNRNNAKYIASYPIGNADDAISKDVRLSFIYLSINEMILSLIKGDRVYVYFIILIFSSVIHNVQCFAINLNVATSLHAFSVISFVKLGTTRRLISIPMTVQIINFIV